MSNLPAKLDSKTVEAVDNWSNSFIRPHIPPALLSNSQIKRTEDDGAKLIYAKFLYGEQTGRFVKQPFNGSLGNVINDLNDESLWIYSLEHEKLPEGFESKTYDGGKIRTGKVEKCHECRGFGEVTCKSCGGKVRWTEKSGDKIIDKVCSCGNGKQKCKECTGYGELETVIMVKKSFRLFETKNSQYKGEVPEEKIKKITGAPIYEAPFEYDINELTDMLRGGINASEFKQLNQNVLDKLHEHIDTNLVNSGVNTKQIHEQLNTLFASVPDPGRDNKLLEKEVMPIRVLVKVEDAPVKQIDYSFKDKDYSLWVFGNENAVWYQTAPFSFNYKMIVYSLVLVGAIVFAILNSMNLI